MGALFLLWNLLGDCDHLFHNPLWGSGKQSTGFPRDGRQHTRIYLQLRQMMKKINFGNDVLGLESKP
jgi:hypothetical protein